VSGTQWPEGVGGDGIGISREFADAAGTGKQRPRAPNVTGWPVGGHQSPRPDVGAVARDSASARLCVLGGRFLCGARRPPESTEDEHLVVPDVGGREDKFEGAPGTRLIQSRKEPVGDN